MVSIGISITISYLQAGSYPLLACMSRGKVRYPLLYRLIADELSRYLICYKVVLIKRKMRFVGRMPGYVKVKGRGCSLEISSFKRKGIGFIHLYGGKGEGVEIPSNLIVRAVKRMIRYGMFQ